MTHTLGWFIVAVVLAIASTRSAAHHSLTSVYDTGRHVKIEGTVTQFQFINPHPIILVEVRDAEGQTQAWRLEMDNRFELVSAGVTNDTLKPGDRITVTGNPGRTQAASLYLRTLDRPADGFRIEQINSGPRVRLRSR